LVSDAGVRARDNAALIQVAREKVLERLQVELELEVHLPGTEFKV
jgi:UDP-N-acetylenolpyruvoylglucosamine reductase